MPRAPLLTLGLALLLGMGLGILLWPSREAPPSPPARSAAPSPIPGAVPAPVEPAASVPAESIASGLVVDAQLRPVPGAEVAFGDEQTVTGEDGCFSFPARPRAGPAELLVRSGGRERARWSQVSLGERRPIEDGTGEATHPPVDRGAPPAGALPTRETVGTRWTVGLAPETVETPAPKSAASPIAVARAVSILVEEWDGRAQIRVRGESPLPDGAHLQLAIYFEGDRMVASIDPPEIRKGAFEGLIPFPEDFPLHPAPLELRLIFGVPLEDPRDVDQWKKDLPGFPWADADDLETIVQIYAGDPRVEEEENRAIEQYFAAVLDRIGDLQKLLLGRARKLRVLAQGWDLALLREWTRPGEWPGEWPEDPLLDPELKPDLAAWRKFLDEGWRPEVLGLLRKHQERTGVKFHSAESLLNKVLRSLLLLSQIESTILYQSLGVPVVSQDFFPDSELPEGDKVILLQILEKELQVLDRYRKLSKKAQDQKARLPAEKRGKAGEKE